MYLRTYVPGSDTSSAILSDIQIADVCVSGQRKKEFVQMYELLLDEIEPSVSLLRRRLSSHGKRVEGVDRGVLVAATNQARILQKNQRGTELTASDWDRAPRHAATTALFTFRQLGLVGRALGLLGDTRIFELTLQQAERIDGCGGVTWKPELSVLDFQLGISTFGISKAIGRELDVAPLRPAQPVLAY